MLSRPSLGADPYSIPPRRRHNFGQSGFRGKTQLNCVPADNTLGGWGKECLGFEPSIGQYPLPQGALGLLGSPIQWEMEKPPQHLYSSLWPDLAPWSQVPGRAMGSAKHSRKEAKGTTGIIWKFLPLSLIPCPSLVLVPFGCPSLAPGFLHFCICLLREVHSADSSSWRLCESYHLVF